jgi:hypothetical protein
MIPRAESGAHFSQIFEERDTHARWNQAPHIQFWGMSSPDVTGYSDEIPKSILLKARRELEKVRPALLRDGVIDVGCGLYPEESFRILSGGDYSMRYIGVDTFEGMQKPLKLFDKVPSGNSNKFIWPKSNYERPLNAAVVRMEMVSFLKEFFDKSSERIHFFVNGHDKYLHWNAKKAKDAQTMRQLERAQSGSMVFGFSLEGGILHLLRSNPKFEMTVHVPAGRAGDGFLFFRRY